MSEMRRKYTESRQVLCGSSVRLASQMLRSRASWGSVRARWATGSVGTAFYTTIIVTEPHSALKPHQLKTIND